MSGIPFVPGEDDPGAGNGTAPRAIAEAQLPSTQDEPLTRVAALGAIYSNHQALRMAIDDARERGAQAVICLGDLGAFGPSPDKSARILREEGIPVVRGNYDDSIARGLEDCQCGYTDPRDNHYARISYEYTLANTSAEHREWMSGFPRQIRFQMGEGPEALQVLAFHGSPRRMNEFLWETTTPTHFLQAMADEADADLLLGTHTGIHWSRRLGRGRWYVNAGALGRPANDGRREVWYTLLELDRGRLNPHFVPVSYDVEALADEMLDEGLPEEFIETIRTGWWTTCLEVLPGKERARGRW